MKLQEKCKTKNCNLDRLYKNNEIVQMFANFRIYVKAEKKKEKHNWQIVYEAVRTRNEILRNKIDVKNRCKTRRQNKKCEINVHSLILGKLPTIKC